MRVISFQSKEVLNIILEQGVYFADSSKLREKRNYTEDVKQLNGSIPIWVFANPDIGPESLQSGDLLEIWRCEMSLDQKVGLTQFFMLELEVENMPPVGKSHNEYKYACVIDRIEKSQLCAVYHVENTNNKFYKKIVLDMKLRDASITEDYLDTREINFYDIFADNSTVVARCSSCGANTAHYMEGIPVCSGYCRDNILQMFYSYSHTDSVSEDAVFKIVDKDIIHKMQTETLKEDFFAEKISSVKPLNFMDSFSVM